MNTLMREGGIIRFRCHTGHGLSSGTLLNSITGNAEDRLYDAVRALDETVLLLNKMGEEFARIGNTRAAEECFDKARGAYERTQPIREAAKHNEQLNAEELRRA